MRLYIIRHADPDYPNKTITAAGHKEAAALAQRWKRDGLDRIYCSPLGRAQHTAQYTAEALKLPVQTEPWTAEMNDLYMDDGPCAGFMAWDLHGEILRTDVHHARTAPWDRLPPLDKPKYRQAVDEMNRQSDAFMARMGYQRDGGRYRIVHAHAERIAVFCHGGFGLTWLSHLLEIPLPIMWAGFWMPPSSVTTILMDQRSDEWAVPRCIGMGDVSHLHAAGLPVQPSGIKANFR